MTKGTLFCVTGPSGSGKTSIMREVMDNELLSFTTRPMREGEVDGRDYIFIKEEQFQNMLESGALAEYTGYDGNFYGLTLEELYFKLQYNSNAFFICDNNGFNQVSKKYNKIVSIFLYADKEDCKLNMANRGDSDEKITARLSTYDDEINNKGQYDYVVKNIRGNRRYTMEAIAWIVCSELKKGEVSGEPTK
jgi:guanylate kinase